VEMGATGTASGRLEKPIFVWEAGLQEPPSYNPWFQLYQESEDCA